MLEISALIIYCLLLLSIKHALHVWEKKTWSKCALSPLLTTKRDVHYANSEGLSNMQSIMNVLRNGV